MPRRKYPLFHELSQKLASTSFGARLSARLFHRLDRFVLALTGGRTTLASLLTGLPLVMLTTTGAKSGQQRTLPLLRIRDETDSRRFALIASNWGQRHYPAWYYNLKANPRATCLIEGQTGDYTAHEAGGEEYARFWNYATDTYAGYSLYKQRIGDTRRIPIMVLTLNEPRTE